MIGTLFLIGCGGPRYVAPADIKPVYDIRNAPIPVPYPLKKPVRSRIEDQAKALKASKGRVIVERGDTLYGLSRRYGIPVEDIVKTNGIAAPFTISVGQVLALPTLGVHVVQKGETGYSISRLYGVTVDSLLSFNDVKPPYTLRVGQLLRLPGQINQPVKSVRQVAIVRDKTRRSPAPPTTLPPAPNTKPTGRQTRPVDPVPKNIQRFSWPVTGRLASRFGPKEGGLHNDGINIFASRGTPVRAAEDGVVAYASNALEGYGNLLLVRHSGGWVTAYAHNERLLVREGDRVKAGQIVARVGSTGGVREPQLHFEIRKGRRALDPLRYLAQRSAMALDVSEGTHCQTANKRPCTTPGA